MRTIGIFSGKGGVGKTTITANLGTVLSLVYGKEVLLIDASPQTPNLCFHFNILNPRFTLQDALSGRSEDVICKHEESGVNLILPPLAMSQAKLENLGRILESLKSFELCLIDSPPGLGKEAVETLKAVEEVVIITTPDLPSVNAALKTIQLAERLGKRILGIVVNRVRGEKCELKEEEIERICGLPVLASLPEKEEIMKSIYQGEPIFLLSSRSEIAKEFKKLAALLIGEEYKESFFEKLLTSLRALFS